MKNYDNTKLKKGNSKSETGWEADARKSRIKLFCHGIIRLPITDNDKIMSKIRGEKNCFKISRYNIMGLHSPFLFAEFLHPQSPKKINFQCEKKNISHSIWGYNIIYIIYMPILLKRIQFVAVSNSYTNDILSTFFPHQFQGSLWNFQKNVKTLKSQKLRKYLHYALYFDLLKK